MKRIALLGAVLFVGAIAGCAGEGAGEPESVGSLSQAVGANNQFCGGIAGFPCPAGYVCVDDPHDNCDPNQGGADCGGICRKAKKPKHKLCDNPARTYISTHPAACPVSRFFCVTGTPFSDACGCGCEVAAGEPCNTVTCAPGEYCCN